VGAGLQPSAVAMAVNLVPELAGLLVAGSLREMGIVRELLSSAWPQPLARVLERNLAHEGGRAGAQITLARVAGRLPVAFSDTPY
jgi:hypothetical protein